MTVGTAGNNTNISPPNYAGVPPKQEQAGEFKAALNDATTSTGASPSAKGKEPSQDTSKSFPIVLANRPPINLGNQIGQQGSPSPAGTTTAPAAAPAPAPAPATKTVPGTSTPVPQDAVVDTKTKEATVQSGDLTVKVKPDRKAGNGQDAKENVKPDGAVTHGDIKVSAKWTTKNGQVTSVTVNKELHVQTTYGSKADPAGGSAYGRGSLKADKDAGNGTLRFHEGNHGQDFIEYARAHPFPTLKIDKPISQQEFDKKKAEFDKQVEQYQKDMEAHSKAHTDDVTDPPATPAASK